MKSFADQTEPLASYPVPPPYPPPLPLPDEDVEDTEEPAEKDKGLEGWMAVEKTEKAPKAERKPKAPSAEPPVDKPPEPIQDPAPKSKNRKPTKKATEEEPMFAKKTCAKCNTQLPTTSFCKNKQTEDGLHRWCRNCVSAYNKARRSKPAKAPKAAKKAAEAEVKTLAMPPKKRGRKAKTAEAAPAVACSVGLDRVPKAPAGLNSRLTALEKVVERLTAAVGSRCDGIEASIRNIQDCLR